MLVLPIRTDSPLRSTPWMNWALISANVIAFMVQWFAWRDNPPGAIDPRDPHLLHYFTYQFLHGDGFHIAGNMLFLYLFGNNVNDRMGQSGYLAFYLAGGVFAGIGHVLTSSMPAIGASGAVAAVTGAYLVLLPRSHVTIFYWVIILFGTIELPALFFILANFAKDFVFGFSMSGEGIAHTAHLAGYIFGFTVSLVLLVVQLLPRDQFDMLALIQRWNRRRQYQGIVRQGFDPFRVGVPAGRGAPHPSIDRIQDLRGQIGDLLAEHKVEDATKYYLELRAIDPQQVLARQNQLDVANQLYSQGTHAAAADAYEGFLRFYPRSDQVEQIQLILGLIYARYLNRPDKAREHLNTALPRLNDSRQQELARDELTKLGGAAPASG
jgi:membrane associated rhomboid family serine protease